MIKKMIVRISLTLGVLLMGTYVVFTQGSVDKLESGQGFDLLTIKFSIGLFPGHDPKFHYKVKLIGENETSQFRYLGKAQRKLKNGVNVDIDEYEMRARKGVYRIVIVEKPEFLLARFKAVPGQHNLEFHLEESNLILDEVCSDVGIVAKMESADDSFDRDAVLNDDVKKDDKSKVATDVFVLDEPFEAVIGNCSKRAYKNSIVFRFARMYYRDYYIEADTIIIDKATKIIRAKGSENSQVLVRKGRGEYVESDKFELSFGSETYPNQVKP